MVPLRKSLIWSTQSKDGPVSHQVEETQQTETQTLSLEISLAYHSSSKLEKQILNQVLETTTEVQLS